MNRSIAATPPQLVNIRLESEDALREYTVELRQSPNLQELLPLVTCERYELFAIVREDSIGSGLKLSCTGPDAALRLFQIAAGVLSAIPGERSVAQQLATQLRQASRSGQAGAILSALVRRACSAGDRLRERVERETPILELPDLVADFIADRFKESAGRPISLPISLPITLLGSGELGRGIATSLVSRGLTLTRWATRSLRPESPATCSIEHALAALEHDAILITALGGNEPILLPNDRRDVFTIDLGSPRNLERADRTMAGLVEASSARIAAQRAGVERAAHRLPARAEAALAETLCPRMTGINRSIAQFREAIVERELMRMQPILNKLPAEDAEKLRKSIQHTAARTAHPMHEYANALGRQGRADEAQCMIDHLLGTRIGWGEGTEARRHEGTKGLKG
ncbi:MAG: hypothetical protein EA377_04110 [Phycisphaerales bacterium]|nr:MAG: hypothetical protein EA377_04110 [Phycisphaerales bacterium]